MKKFIVIAAQMGKGKLGTGRLFLIDNNGNTLKVNANFAKANGIDEHFRGMIMYKDQFCKKGDEYTTPDGKKGTYTNDFNKIVSIIPAEGSVYSTTFQKELVRKELFASAVALVDGEE
jgi:hypothetical protein